MVYYLLIFLEQQQKNRNLMNDYYQYPIIKLLYV